MVNPVSLSADGKRNAFYFRCSVVGQSRPYAGCLSRIDSPVNLDADCTTAIRQCNCPAQGMRQDEVVAGQALHFVERTNEVAAQTRKWLEGVKPEGQAIPVPRDPGKPGLFSKMLDVSTAVIEAALKKDTSPVVAAALAPKESQPSRPVQQLKLLPGESPIDAIRRMKAQPA